MIFGNFPLGGRLRGDWPFIGMAPKSRGGAEDFDEFCKNVIEKFSNIQ